MLSLIRVRTEQGSLNVRSEPARLEGAYEKKELSIRGNNGAHVSLQTTHPQIQIDQTDSFASVGLKKWLPQYLEFCEKGWQAGLERIAGISSEGIRMMQIEKGGNAIAEIARNKGYKDVRLTVTSVAPPQISVIPGTVEIQDASSKIQTEMRDIDSTKRYTPASIDISWKVRPSIEIWVEPGVEIDLPDTNVGTRVNRAV
ncbi:MAG: DUF6470 family protein [Oscillospiraceae bacterium]|jgi:hypothetical protein|nr:DUF6470 family protein [Oscillospiraceae bacterium]